MTENRFQLIDKYGRHINYLRISLTDRCNLRCIYCTPYQGIVKLKHEDILTYEEILRLAKIAINLGVDKVRLTGGEPLVRKDIYDFLPKLASLNGLREICLTTNGVFLRQNLDKIKSSGIKRLNISLDSLNPEKYKKITGRDCFNDTWEGINLAKKMGFDPIKINAVLLKGLNDDEILDLAGLSLKGPYHIRFIEYMPLGITETDGTSLRHVPSSEIKARLESLGKLVSVPKSEFDGPAERFKIEGAPGEIGFISPLTHHFCHTCNRLRLTANGHLRPCLLSDREVDLKGPMRKGASDSELKKILVEAALSKPHSHYLSGENSNPLSGQMCAIGG